MVQAGKVEEVISFLVEEATGVGEWVALEVVMLAGVGGNVILMIVTTWMGEDVGVDVLTIEEMLVIGIEAEAEVAALKGFGHGIIVEVAVEAEAEVAAGVGAGVGAAVVVAAGLVAGAAATAVASAGVPVTGVVAGVEVTAAVLATAVVEAAAMTDAVD